MTEKRNTKAPLPEGSPKRWWGRWWELIATGVIAGLIIWAITRHYDEPATSTTTEQLRTQPQVQPPTLDKPTSQDSTRGQSTHKHRDGKKPERDNPAPPITQDCHGGNCAVSVDQKGGITAGQITVNAAEHLSLSDQGVDRIGQVSRGRCPPQTVSVSLNNANDETGKFGEQLKLALERAGIQVDLGSVIAFGANGPIPRGVVLDAGDNCLDLAESVAQVLASDNAVSPTRLRVTHVTVPDWRDRLSITVSPPN